MAFDDRRLDDYVDVAERIAEFRDKYPDGRLQPLNLKRPYEVRDVAGQQFIVYVAACYRDPDDPRPGVGSAWEPFPGRTPYTRSSELMNAETSAWGRAIMAALVADAKRGVATRQEIQARHEERNTEQQQPRPGPERVGPDENAQLAQAQELAQLAAKIVESADGTVEQLRANVYEPARQARILRTVTTNPFTGREAQLSAIITAGKTRLSQIIEQELAQAPPAEP